MINSFRRIITSVPQYHFFLATNTILDVRIPLEIDSVGQKTAKNTVVIRPGKLDRSPCGTGTSARLALLRKKNQIQIGEKIVSQSIIGSTFETFIESENQEFSKMMIRPNIKGSAFITGEQILYKDDQDPFPQGYRLNDTWP